MLFEPFRGVRWSGRVLPPGATPLAPGAGHALVWPDGDVMLTRTTDQLRLRADDLALIEGAPPTILTCDVACTVRMLAFDRSAIAWRSERSDTDTAIKVDGGDPLARVIRQLWTIGAAIDGTVMADEQVEGRLVGLIGELASKLLADRGQAPVSTHAAAMVARARRLIVTHCADPSFGPAGLAALMRVSPRHLSSLFAATGTTATSAILEQRLGRARTLLADPAHRHRQIANIAAACGFVDQSYFARCFGRETGLSPRDFRQNGVNSD